MGMGPINRLVSRGIARVKGATPAGPATGNRVMSKVVAAARAKQVAKPVMPGRIMGGPVKVQTQRGSTGGKGPISAPSRTVIRTPTSLTIKRGG